MGNFYFSSDFDGIFFIWFVSLRAFSSMSTNCLYLLLFSKKKGQSGEKIQFYIIWKFFLFHVILIVFFPNYSLWKMQPKITLVLRIMRVKMITYIVILWCVQHFTVSSTLLCPELYCVQHITVSNTLLCQAKYCVHTYPKDLLSTFHISTCCGRIMCLRSTSVH